MTGVTAGWRDRLLGLLHSPYRPTDPALFREMLDKGLYAPNLSPSALRRILQRY